jgi:phosphoribosylamine--glycine ligase
VIIGPEAPLVAGSPTRCASAASLFGPGRAAAALEGSKAFAKRIMDAAGAHRPRRPRRDPRRGRAALDAYGAPYVVKADGLAAGKGVVVTDDRAAALAHADAFLAAGPVLVEEFLSGPEVSLFFVSDGDTVRALARAGLQARLRRRRGPEHGRHGRVLAAAVARRAVRQRARSSIA